PPPTFETKGRFMKAAKNAFNRNDYDEAMAQARRALAEDPNDASAKGMIESALNGQKAEQRFRLAENALRAKDFEKATTEANAGRGLAPWDERAGQILRRIQAGQQQAAAEAAAATEAARRGLATQQLNGFIASADAALAGQKYDEAIGLYDKALNLDPANPRA